ncbi:acyl carrier protein phosphodiesterase [Alcanivorax hongdengensis]|uniref:acyl carrier protein phosphodiesterase n=1 Tax=Alcanivorax hongdengensis TaxID=519051 RepID=UPI00058CCDD5|nr:ACP phosphodiesterase [Alcanivorax hongdengensis]
MNYLAHLSLSRPTVASRVGNVLGDFMRGVDVQALPETVQRALDNHRLVDRVTDQHPSVRQARALFSPSRRRFAGVAMDVLFDHFLWQHWSRFHDRPLQHAIGDYYRQLQQGQALMPPAMQAAVGRMRERDLLNVYASLEGVSEALDAMAARIRFTNSFAGIGEELALHYDTLEQVFLALYPHLDREVTRAAIETPG